MSIDFVSQILGIAASIIAILGFFGIAYSVDAKRERSIENEASIKPRRKEYQKGTKKINNKQKETPHLFLLMIGGSIGGASNGLIFTIVSEILFFPPIDIEAIILSSLTTGLIWSIGMSFGGNSLNVFADMTKSCIVGGSIGLAVVLITMPYFHPIIFFQDIVFIIITCLTSFLIGVSNSANNGMMIGAVGSGITGIIYGLLIGPAGPIIGFFVGIVSGACGGFIAVYIARYNIYR